MTGFLLIMGIVDLFLLLWLGRHWKSLNKVGRVTMSGLVFLFWPVCWGGAMVLHGIGQMTEESFCQSCHVMEAYSASLRVDDMDSLPASHFQNNYVPQKTACYDCHTQYTMFGGVKAKISGLKHVWVNYVTGVPDEIKLYEPYSNRDCLRCHGTAKNFLESEDHVDDLEDIKSGELSCLDCHDTGHVME